MLKIFFITTLILYFSFCIHSQTSQLAKDYHKALKQESSAGLRSYLWDAEAAKSLLSWPQGAAANSYMDSINHIYTDSLTEHIKALSLNLKKDGFLLKNSRLVKAERSLGAYGVLSLLLAHKGKKKTIFVKLMDVNGKDYINRSYPSIKAIKLSNHAGSIMIDNQRYFLWHLRTSELEQIRAIVKAAEPIKVDGEEYPNYGWMGLTNGIMMDDERRYAYTIAFKANSKTKVIITIDLKEEKIVKIQKEIPIERKNIMREALPETNEVVGLIAKKYNQAVADKFIILRQKREKFEAFVNELRNEIVEQSGGYIEANGRKIPKGKKDKDVPHRILITEGKGKELKLKMQSLEAAFVQFLEETGANETVQQQLALKVREDALKKQGKTWEAFAFAHMPVAAIFSMFRKFQNDAKDSEAVVINYLLEK